MTIRLSPIFPITPILLAAAAGACDSCGCSLPPELPDRSIAVGAEDSGLGGIRLGVLEQYTDLSTLREDGRKVGNPSGQWLRSSTTQIIATWQAGGPWSVALFVPYVSRSYHRPGSSGMEDGTVAGLGDIVLLGSYRIAHLERGGSTAVMSLQAGLKMPTGDPGQLAGAGDESGEVEGSAVGGHDLALGTGSWDVLVGANAIARMGAVFTAAQAMYTRRHEGAYQYRMADDATATASLGWEMRPAPGSRFAVQANLIGESKGLDRVDGAEADDSANHNLFAGPELGLRRGGLGAMLALDLPLVERNSATQLVPTWRLRARLEWDL